MVLARTLPSSASSGMMVHTVFCHRPLSACFASRRRDFLFGTVPRHSRAKAEIQFHPASTKFGDAASEVQQMQQQPPPAVIIHLDTTIYLGTTHISSDLAPPDTVHCRSARHTRIDSSNLCSILCCSSDVQSVSQSQRVDGHCFGPPRSARKHYINRSYGSRFRTHVTYSPGTTSNPHTTAISPTVISPGSEDAEGE